MEFLTGSTGAGVHEHLFNIPSQVVGHRTIAKGEVTGKGELHPAPAHGVVIPIKGRIKFNTADGSEEIYPGRAVVMERGELHSMEGLEDSELMVVLSRFD
ncbi:hypothetical protein MK904_09970 [Loigolactobacillus coryniformis]|uniref:hypothetical protein n=1 Tax=Loigolactobacillus coryniformis TaxID=1610 RepID=UPI0023422991|nr:hypothetical protein [Loigolactobacillus coryniformis]MDC4186427.1 hypothetical protein [Loigolactobacillus coryniformis]